MNTKIPTTSISRDSGSHSLEPETSSNPAIGHFNSQSIESLSNSSPFRPIGLQSPHSVTPSDRSVTPSSQSIDTTSSEFTEEESPTKGGSSPLEKFTPISTNSSQDLQKNDKIIPTHEEKLHDALTSWEEKLEKADRLLNRAKEVITEASNYLNQRTHLYRPLNSTELLQEEDLPRFISETIQESKASLSEIQSAMYYYKEVVNEGLDKGVIIPPENQNQYTIMYRKSRDLQGEFAFGIQQLSRASKEVDQLQGGITDSED
ncbi:MAG: hypothetical protein QE493_07030 [Verrucomicrobiae bacterium]|jgi:hypothetical protein|nr:hypothetical protein [Verrucomicrobiae bacterium]